MTCKETNCFEVPRTCAKYMPDVSRDDARKGLFTNPKRRLTAELYCFLLIFVPHTYNDNSRKYLTLILFFAWALIEVGAAFGVAMIRNQFIYIRGLVLVLLGRMWGLELNNFAGVEFTTRDENDGND